MKWVLPLAHSKELIAHRKKDYEMIEFSSRRPGDRRKNPCYIERDRRVNPARRGLAARELEKKRRTEFKRHLNAQR
jgi:hypothetical protein